MEANEIGRPSPIAGFMPASKRGGIGKPQPGRGDRGWGFHLRDGTQLIISTHATSHPVYGLFLLRLRLRLRSGRVVRRFAVWEITLRCDLGCRHCGSRAGRVRKDELSTAEALDLVHQLADFGLKEVTLIAGEFYMRDDWDLIAAEIDRNGMLCSIVTGARQMTDERVRRAVAARVGKISISIDGLERTHDAIRGSAGSWKAAIAAARRIGASGIR